MTSIGQDVNQPVGIPEVFTINDVVDRGLCVGCGACAVVDSNVRLTRNQYGSMVAAIDANIVPGSIADRVCPFSDNSLNEDVVGERVFASCENFDQRTGYYTNLYYGRRFTEAELLKSSSGGLTSYVAIELLKRHHVDGIIHVGRDQADDRDALFKFMVSYTEEDANACKKSQYYSLSFDEVVRSIRGDGKRYVFVGVPCFVKSLRNICLNDAVLNEQIPFMLGLVCGHLKSSRFAELLAWQLSVPPEKIQSVDFRVKNNASSVNSYDFQVVDIHQQAHAKTSNTMLGGNWGHAAFQLQACDYCDDIFAETADAVFGDAWLPQFSTWWQGTNIVLVRNPIIDDILESGKNSGAITLGGVSIDDLCKSQLGNFRHRKDGLIVRLDDDLKQGKKVPKKRVDLSALGKIDQKRKKIVRLRKEMAVKSHEYFLQAREKHDLSLYMKPMGQLARNMLKLYRDPFMKRLINRLKRYF